jgi:hypothetical protein
MHLLLSWPRLMQPSRRNTGRYNVILDSRVKPGHDNGESISGNDVGKKLVLDPGNLIL